MSVPPNRATDAELRLSTDPRTGRPSDAPDVPPPDRLDPQDQTIFAVVHHRYGSADVLELGRVPRPQVGKHDVLVRVHAAGLDRGAWHFMTGTPYLLRLASGLGRPRHPVLGRELAGVVIAVGEATTRYSPGDQVYGIGRGAFAELATAPESKLAPMPTGLTFEQAAVAPISGVTALRAVHDVAGVRAGHRVLVTGASGGVGSFAVQMAKVAGAEVTGECSAAKADYVRGLGADHVLDYREQDFADGTQQYDRIIDLAGTPGLRRLRRALAPGGIAVLTGGEEGGALTGGLDRQLRGRLLSPFIGRRLTSFMPQERASDLERVTALLEAGAVTPSVGGTWPLEQAAEAMAELEGGRARGKIAISVHTEPTRP